VKSSVKMSVSALRAVASSSASVNPFLLFAKAAWFTPGGFFHGALSWYRQMQTLTYAMQRQGPLQTR
jgi:hypothetical protein